MKARKRGPFILLSPEGGRSSAEIRRFMGDLTKLHSREGMVQGARTMAERELGANRIFDWRKHLVRNREFEPVLEFAIDVMWHAEQVDYWRAKGDVDNAVCEAMGLGSAWAKLAAAIAWRDRDTTTAAQKGKQDKQDKRRAALSSFIESYGERPDSRPGRWYQAFRDQHPEHAATDATLRADYRHALVRK